MRLCNANRGYHKAMLWRPAHWTQPNFAKRWTVNRESTVEKLGSSLPKIGDKNLYNCSVSRRLRDLMANICWQKRGIDNRARALESRLRRVMYVIPKISWTWVHKQLKPDRSFYPPSLFCFVPVHRTPCCRLWRPTATLKMKRHWVRLQLRFKAPNTIVSGGLKWQCIAIIATFSSYHLMFKNVSRYFSADLCPWLDSPMLWAPWQQSVSTYSQPSFSSSSWKRGAVWMYNLGVISQERLDIVVQNFSYCWVPIGSDICRVDWHNNGRPWVTLNGIIRIAR